MNDHIAALISEAHFQIHAGNCTGNSGIVKINQPSCKIADLLPGAQIPSWYLASPEHLVLAHAAAVDPHADLWPPVLSVMPTILGLS